VIIRLRATGFGLRQILEGCSCRRLEPVAWRQCAHTLFSRTLRVVKPTLITIILVAATDAAHAYLKLGANVGLRTVELRWSRQPIRYFITDRGVPGVSAAQLQTAVGRASRTWQDVPTSSVAFQFVGFTSAEPSDDDGIVTLGFQDRPDLETILGSTRFVVDVLTGELVEADIFLNSNFPWSVAVAGENGRFDVESIALHEIGHLAGLSHSLLGETELTSGRRRVIAAEAVMFPIAFSAGVLEGRTLRADDIAGVSDLYPDGGFSTRTGSVQGRITKDGRGVFGVHVVAFHTRTGALVGGFTVTTSGDFVIAGLAPGPHVLRVEPLDDARVESFFGDSPLLDTGFGVTYFERLVIVPEGSNVGPVEIRVRSQ